MVTYGCENYDEEPEYALIDWTHPEGRAYLDGLRSSHPGASKRERAVRKLVDFLLSEEFARQEQAMERIRRRRLK